MTTTHLKLIHCSPKRFKTVAAIDDDPSIHLFLKEFLESLGIQFQGFQSPLHALEKIRYGNFDLILVDFKMPGVDGLTLMRYVSEQQPNVPVVLMTAFANVRVAVDAMKAGAHDLIEKDSLANTLEAILDEIDK